MLQLKVSGQSHEMAMVAKAAIEDDAVRVPRIIRVEAGRIELSHCNAYPLRNLPVRKQG